MMLEETKQMITDLTAAVEAVRKELHDSLNESKERRAHVDSILEKLMSAFPDGDIDGHRRGHMALIAEVEAKKERIAELRRLRFAITEKTIVALLWLASAAIATLIYKGIKAELTARGIML